MIVTDDVLNTMAATLATQLLSRSSGGLGVAESETDQQPVSVLYQNGLARLLRNFAETPAVQNTDQLYHMTRAWLDRPQASEILLGLALSGPTPYVNVQIQNVQGLVVGDGTQVTMNFAASSASPAPRLRQLPAPVEDFVGRDAEVDRIERALSQTAQNPGKATIGVIRGLGGVGKTALAYAVANRLAEQSFPDAQLVINLRGASTHPLSAEQALQAIVRSFDSSPQLPDDVSELLTYYRSFLSQQRTLVVADDARDAAQVKLLLPPPGSALLVTSRQHFSLPGMTSIDLGTLPATASEQLLLNVCPRIGEHAPALARLCGYLPLALRVAASTLANGSRRVERFLNQLAAERLKYLRDPDSGEEDPEASVEASLRLSYDALEPAAQQVLCQVSIFASRFDRNAAQHVVRADGDTEDWLDYLQRRSLVEWDASQDTFLLHDLVRSFASERLEQAAAVHRRAGEHYEADRMTALIAAQHYLSAGEHSRSAQVLGLHSRTIISRGEAASLASLLEQLDDATLNTHARVAVHTVRAEIHLLRGEFEPARAAYNAALAHLARVEPSPSVRQARARIYRGLGESYEHASTQQALEWLQRGLNELSGEQSLEEAFLRFGIGSALIGAGDNTTAAQALEASLCLLPDSESDWRARVLMNLGVTHCSQNDMRQGQSYFVRALEIYQQTGNKWQMAALYQNLGMLKDITGDWSGAAEDYRAGLDLAELLGDVVRQAELSLPLGNLHVKQGDTAAAQVDLTRCLALVRQHNLREQLVYVQASLAHLYIKLAAWGEAEAALVEAGAIARDMAGETHPQLPEIYRGWALLRLADGKTGAALEAAERSVTFAHQLEASLDEGMGLRVLGQALLAAGRRDEALGMFEQSLALLDGSDPYEAARTKAAWGSALAGEELRTRLLSEARAAFEALGAKGEVDMANASLQNYSGVSSSDGIVKQ